ncbi:hypothetical protein BC835DRAFT_1311680 [Cytidiella melzeri]|nr:hypothetical protein BC835DRAFT_1311680 [Cytidiella melzeri]
MKASMRHSRTRKARRSKQTKKKAQEAQVSEDDMSDGDNPQTPPAKNYENLQKIAEKLKKENKALKQSQAKALKNDNAGARDANIEEEDNNFSPEEEDNDFVSYESPFQSRGTIETTQQPPKRLIRRVNNPKVTVVATNMVTPLLVDTRQECAITPASFSEPTVVAIVAPAQLNCHVARWGWPATSDLLLLGAREIQDTATEPALGEEPRRRGRAQSSLDGQAQHQHKRPRTTLSSAAPPPHSELEYKGGVKPALTTKPKEGDYSGATAKIISRSILRYELKILTEVAFSEHDTQYAWAREVFHASCQEFERAYSRDNEEATRIYNLANADLVKRLLEPVGHLGNANRYCYKLLTADKPNKNFGEDPPRGLMLVPIIVHALQDIIACRSGGSTRPPPGVEFRSLFDPLPLPTIALLLTMVRYGLQRWSTGQLIQKDRTHKFRESTYKTVFTEHLRHLEDWAALNQMVTTKIRSAMYKTVLQLGGFSLADEKQAGLSNMAKESALQDLEDWTAGRG